MIIAKDLQNVNIRYRNITTFNLHILVFIDCWLVNVNGQTVHVHSGQEQIQRLIEIMQQLIDETM